MKMSKLKSNALAVLAVMFLPGCASLDFLEPSADPTEFHLLESAVSSDAIAKLKSDGPAILVGSNSLAKHLEHRQIALYSGPNRIEYAGIHRWGEPLEEGVNRILIDRLASDLGTSQVSFLRVAGNFEWDYRVGYHISRVGGTPGDKVELRVNWWLRAGGETTRRHENSVYEAEAVGGSRNYEGYVAAIQTVLDAWAKDVAAAIKEM